MTIEITRQPIDLSVGLTPGWHFDHVNVSVGGTSSLSALFEDVMGLQDGYRPPFPFPGRWLYAQGQAVVHAAIDTSLANDGGEVCFGHIAFRSHQPVAPLIEKLRRSGLTFRMSRVPKDNIAQIFVLLPGDFVVELDVPYDENLADGDFYGASQAASGG